MKLNNERVMREVTPRGLPGCAGYSLVEVLAACGIIALGVGAALALSLATVSQEETGHRIARAVAIGENAARLYGLGLSPDEIVRILPPDPVLSSITIREDELEVDGVGHSSTNERQRDEKRTAFLKNKGWRVIRFWNEDIYEDVGSVVKAIAGHLSTATQAEKVDE